MRAPQESLSCQYILPNGDKCNAPLSGRGRWKWCEKCSLLVRKEKQRQRARSWQSSWRTRHPKRQQIKNLLYRQAKEFARKLTQGSHRSDLEGLQAIVNKDLRYVSDDRPWLRTSVGILPVGGVAFLYLKFSSSQQPMWHQPWLVKFIP
jgi:beta-lactamase class D